MKSVLFLVACVLSLFVVSNAEAQYPHHPHYPHYPHYHYGYRPYVRPLPIIPRPYLYPRVYGYPAYGYPVYPNYYQPYYQQYDIYGRPLPY